jgi:geranylgeranyl pyrophosphate synthase
MSMTLEESSRDATRCLVKYIETHLSDAPPAFRDDVLHAVSIAAPLRERTHLVRIAAELSGAEWSSVEPFAFAAELFITSGLTADDVIDGAESRSREPTLFSRRGAARSVLVAEWLHSIAQLVLWNRPKRVSEEAWHTAAERFHVTYSSFFIHQYLESHEEGNQHVTHGQVDRLARGRTGMLLEACLTSPAIISDSKSLAESLAECGRWLGMAFQHRDDILDFIGNPAVLGKPVLLDLLSGQPNLVLSHSLSATADQSAQDVIRRHFSTSQHDRNVLKRGVHIQNEVLSALRTSGSIAFASEVVRDYCNRATHAISGLPPSLAKRELMNTIDTIGGIDFPWEDGI